MTSSLYNNDTLNIIADIPMPNIAVAILVFIIHILTIVIVHIIDIALAVLFYTAQTTATNGKIA